MAGKLQLRVLKIGQVAARTNTTVDTVRYYERLGLLETPLRGLNSYRVYSEEDVRRLQFIRRAKFLNFSLNEIGQLLDIAEQGKCRPLRQQVIEQIGTKITECELKMEEMAAFKASLEERLQKAQALLEQASGDCSSFAPDCSCLPVKLDELTQPQTTVNNNNHNHIYKTHKSH